MSAAERALELADKLASREMRLSVSDSFTLSNLMSADRDLELILRRYAEILFAEPVAYGMPNSSITGMPHALMMVSVDIPSNDQHGGALWVPLIIKPGDPT